MAILLLLLAAATIMSSEAFMSSFPSEPDYSSSSSYDPESAMEERALHVIRSCWKFSETNSVESGELWADPESMPTGGEFVVVDRVIPEFQVCAPTFTWGNFWPELVKRIEEDRPEPENKKKKNPDDPKTQKKKIAGRKKVVAVSHPLVRVAKAYLETFVEAKEEENNRFKRVKEHFAQGNRITFKDFVHFLTRAGHKLPELLDVVGNPEFNRGWLPYHRQCPICHPDNYPSYVLKLESPRLEEDLEFLQEAFDLEDVELPEMPPEHQVVSDSSLKALYGQLSQGDLEELVELFHVDMHAFRYSPEKFQEMVGS